MPASVDCGLCDHPQLTGRVTPAAVVSLLYVDRCGDLRARAVDGELQIRGGTDQQHRLIGQADRQLAGAGVNRRPFTDRI
ncbi:MAG: hypothetical protein IPP82_00955 [Xanthomonadales bacterium]|nr:hypothetical protein [Xanthomonadales bacterium]